MIDPYIADKLTAETSIKKALDYLTSVSLGKTERVTEVDEAINNFCNQIKNSGQWEAIKQVAISQEN